MHFSRKYTKQHQAMSNLMTTTKYLLEYLYKLYSGLSKVVGNLWISAAYNKFRCRLL